MFDVTNKTSFEHAKDWKDDLDEKVVLPNGEPIPCILLANKVAAHKRGLFEILQPILSCCVVLCCPQETVALKYFIRLGYQSNR